MSKIFSHLKSKIFKGLMTLLPFFLIYLVLDYFYLAIDNKILNIFDSYFGYRIPGLGLIILVVVLYLIGLITAKFFSHWIFASLEKYSMKIPLIGSTFKVGKQISGTIAMPEKQFFKKVVLVEYLRPGVKVVGFVTGKVSSSADGKNYLKVFIPNPPIPTSGILIIIEETLVFDPGWSVDEGIQTVISGGIIGPEKI